MEGWENKTLDELCEIARGGSPRPIKEFITDDPNGINWIKIGDATASSKYILETKQKIKPEGAHRSRMVHPGDFLLSNSMSFGRPYIMKTSGCIHDGWLVLSDKSGLFHQDYLYHFLGSTAAYKQFDSRAAGSTVRNLNIDLVRTVEIPLPPLPEQERIVAILDEAFAAIATATANAEKNLANARELFESYMGTAIDPSQNGWEIRELQQDVKFIDYRGKTPQKTESGLRLITAKNVRMGKLNEHPAEFVSEDSYESWMTRGIPAPGDVLFTTEAPLGLVCQLDTEERVVFAQRIITLQPDRSVIDPAFLHYALRSPLVQESLHANATGATAQGIKASRLKKIEIPIPTNLDDQKNLAKELEQCERDCLNIELLESEKLQQLTNLKQSLLQKAFTGELTADTNAADRTLSEASV